MNNSGPLIPAADVVAATDGAVVWMLDGWLWFSNVRGADGRIRSRTQIREHFSDPPTDVAPQSGTGCDLTAFCMSLCQQFRCSSYFQPPPPILLSIPVLFSNMGNVECISITY